MDSISPALWVMEGFDITPSFDPTAEVQKKFFGDWENVTNMSNALHDIAINVQSGASTLAGYWQGNAGHTAYRYFTDLSTAVERLTSPLGEVRRPIGTWLSSPPVWRSFSSMID